MTCHTFNSKTEWKANGARFGCRVQVCDFYEKKVWIGIEIGIGHKFVLFKVIRHVINCITSSIYLGTFIILLFCKIIENILFIKQFTPPLLIVELRFHIFLKYSLIRLSLHNS